MKKIALVEDDADLAYTIQLNLEREGYAVENFSNGQEGLIAAETGAHIWADRFEGRLEDIFDLQDRITESVVGAVEPSLRLAEVKRARSKPTDDLRAYDYFLRAWQKLSMDPRRQGIDEALEELRRAIELDPDNPKFLKTIRGVGYRLDV